MRVIIKRHWGCGGLIKPCWIGGRDGMGRKYFLECEKCHVCTSLRQTHAEAVDEWNSKYPDSPQVCVL